MDIKIQSFERIKVRKPNKLLFAALIIITSFFSSLNVSAQEDEAIQAGKKLFNANCAACHKINKRAVGPALKGVSAKYDKEWLYSWIKNSTAMVKSGDAQAVAVYEEYNGSVMTSFPQLSNADIDNIIAYTDYTPPAPVAAAGVKPVVPNPIVVTPPPPPPPVVIRAILGLAPATKVPLETSIISMPNKSVAKSMVLSSKPLAPPVPVYVLDICITYG